MPILSQFRRTKLHRLLTVLVATAVSLGFTAPVSAHDESDSRSSNRQSPIVNAVKMALPSVVNISTERIVSQSYNRHGRVSPITEFFNQFLGLQQQYYKTNSLGSGVIVDKNGLVLTNNHVVQRASRIIVTLTDGSDYDAKPIATDSANDLALLKLEGLNVETTLVPIEFAVPDDLYLGEQVVTVGNPYGLNHSVSAGVLSAVARKFVYDNNILFDDILQTDAPINPGNSGGPLINVDGKLIGINLAIHDDAEGIGFAIPLKRIEDILTEWMIPERFGLNNCGFTPGTSIPENNVPHAYIRNVASDSPAARAGLAPGSIIRKVNGITVSQAIDVGRAIWNLKAGNEVQLTLDNGSTVSITVEALPELSGEEYARTKLKVELQLLTERLARAMGLPYSRGLVVSDVEQDGRLARRGVQRGDVIIQIGNVPVTDFADLHRALIEAQPGDVIDFVVDRLDKVRGRLLLYRYILDVPI